MCQQCALNMLLGMRPTVIAKQYCKDCHFVYRVLLLRKRKQQSVTGTHAGGSNVHDSEVF